MSKKKGLRSGYTTGACATAATKAALLMLIEQSQIYDIEIQLPIGERVRFPIQNSTYSLTTATAGVIKDAGDDPDVTHGALILSTVSWLDEERIEIDGGKGVGRVTKPGLPVPIGEAAINPVPRRMIEKEVKQLLEFYQLTKGVKVVISVPNGEELAKKTLNPRLGIIGGISILGSRGTVIPYSHDAYQASIVQAIRVARINGIDHFILTTGSTSEKIAQNIFKEKEEMAFIQMGEFVGFALKHAKRLGAKKVTILGMIGKLSKVAQGKMMVHSKESSIDFQFLANIANRLYISNSVQEKIKQANTAAWVEKIIIEENRPSFFAEICRLVALESLSYIQGGLILEVILVSKSGRVLGRVEIDDWENKDHWHR
ncbi:cobalt-precorrin-5B (C(1))-methyltransferase [Tepidibacillus sp. LV47]|uniref:cobalt-precorrin-5B (C(1))-methyltransferase n=1 Tax=Tepidibacillus sp. LV47 TaxID=3398228 RepID=UPI003AAA8284